MKQIGRYETLERLGEGSMGMIYRAKDTVLDRDVALKVLSTEGVQDEELLERFCREARACARLRHPNIVTVYDFGQTEGLAFIAMELLEGSDLRRIIADNRSMALKEKLHVMAGVCDGLQHAHSVGIVHRDLKPSNIFVGTDGQGRILDFGVAHMPASSLTTVGRALGTPHYMSPEQILGKPCDGRSDIFSTAITTFELIAGQHPFGKSPTERIAEGKPDALLSINPAFSPELNQLLAKGLAREPDNRYRSAAEFALALRKAADNVRNGPATFPRSTDRHAMSPPPGTETVMSAVLINLQKFEEAADQGNLDAARQALVGMKQAGAEHSRYVVALQRSQERLKQLEKQCPVAVRETKVTRFEKLTPKPAPVPAVASRSETATLFDSPKTFAAPHVQIMPEEAPPTPPSRDVGTVAVQRSRMRWAVPVILLLCGIAAAAFLFIGGMFDTPSPLTPVAAAEVVSAEAPLFSKPDSGETAITVAHRGDKLKILRAPRFREQQWTEVQWPSSGHLTQAAFARTTDLGNWSSSDPSLAAELQQMFAPSSYVSLDPLSPSR